MVLDVLVVQTGRQTTNHRTVATKRVSVTGSSSWLVYPLAPIADVKLSGLFRRIGFRSTNVTLAPQSTVKTVGGENAPNVVPLHAFR